MMVTQMNCQYSPRICFSALVFCCLTAAVFAGVILPGCARNIKPRAIELAAPASWTRSTGELPIYWRQSGEARLYLTHFRQCGERAVTSAALGRQLFVGFEKLNIIETGSVAISGTTFYYQKGGAEFDSNNMLVVSFTAKSNSDNDCVSDYVFWQPASEPASSNFAVSALADELEQFLNSSRI